MRTLFLALFIVASFGCGSASDPGGRDAAVASATDGGGSVGADAGADAGGDAGAGAAALGLVTAAGLHAELENKDFLLIDVHTPYAGVIPGTDARIAYTDIDALADYIGGDLDRKVVLTCLSGSMSDVAGNALVGRGYRAIRHLQGGMNAWTAAGYPLAEF